MGCSESPSTKGLFLFQAVKIRRSSKKLTGCDAYSQMPLFPELCEKSLAGLASG